MRKEDMRQAGRLMLIVSYGGIPTWETVLGEQFSDLSGQRELTLAGDKRITVT